MGFTLPVLLLLSRFQEGGPKTDEAAHREITPDLDSSRVRNMKLWFMQTAPKKW